MRNSNVLAIAPTATISYIQGCSPSIDPDFSTFFVYENKSGNLFITNEWFIKECKELNIWTPKLIEALKAVDGDPLIEVKEVELQERMKYIDDYKLMSLPMNHVWFFSIAVLMLYHNYLHYL